MPYEIKKKQFEDAVEGFQRATEGKWGEGELKNNIKLTSLNYKVIFFINEIERKLLEIKEEHKKYSDYLKSSGKTDMQNLQNIFTENGETTEATRLQLLTLVDLPSLLFGYYIVCRVFLDCLNNIIARKFFNNIQLSYSKLWEEENFERLCKRFCPKKELDLEGLKSIYEIAHKIDQEVVDVRDSLVHDYPSDSLFLSPNHEIKIKLKNHKTKEEFSADVFATIRDNNKMFIDLLGLLTNEINKLRDAEKIS